MKMARASERDLEVAISLAQALESFDSGYMPLPLDATDEHRDSPQSDRFDENNREHLRRFYDEVIQRYRSASLFRVVFGFMVALDHRNEIFDPASDCLELHSRLRAALAAAPPVASSRDEG